MYHQYIWTKASEVRNAITEIYEPLQPYLLLELCRRFEPEVFFDIGSNIGAYSIALSSLTSLKTILAFEPAPEALKELEENIRLNHLDGRIVPMNVALSNREGHADFAVIHALSGANGIADTHIHGPEKRERVISVPVKPLDKIYHGASRRIAMKVDVEGHEIMALEGAQQLIGRSDCLVQVEFYRNVEEGRRFMERLGFRYLFHVGPDHYFGKGSGELEDRELVAVFEAAASQMLAEMQRNAQRQAEQKAVIKRNIAPSVAIEVSGALASVLRGIRHSIKTPR